MRGQVIRARFEARTAVFGRDGARRRATLGQYVLAALVCGVLGWFWSSGPRALLHTVHGVIRVFFAGVVTMRLAALALSRRPASAAGAFDGELPFYSVILPLRDEASVVPSLVRGLRAIDYPADRIEFLFALEPDDAATLAAVRRERLAALQVVMSAPGGPRTKPHACNTALSRARGELVVVFDAEDRPHPLQLREAAARFAEGPDDLVCLQAPLRIRPSEAFLRRQFGLEYAVLFETLLPAMARLGLPFPLGGTSNHFKHAALAAAGGWDAYNVTEDADIGLRLGACGGRLGVLSCPTHEPAPPSLEVWTPQRTRWIKGHLQTWLVHMRRPFRGGLRSFLALQPTLGVNTASSLMHGPLAMGVGACLLIAACDVAPPAISLQDLALLAAGWISAALCMAVGARRAGLRVRASDLLLAPAYWPLQSLAAVFAAWELAWMPHHWNKTPHAPEAEADEGADHRALPARVSAARA